MFHTHLSHYGLTEAVKTDTHVFLDSPDLGAVKRAAFAHGFEIEDHDYRLLGGDLPEYPVYDTTTIVRYWLRRDSGETAMIQKVNPDTWCVMLPLSVWDAER